MSISYSTTKKKCLCAISFFSLDPTYPSRTHSAINYFLTLPNPPLSPNNESTVRALAWDALFVCLLMRLFLAAVGQGVVMCFLVCTATHVWSLWTKGAFLPPSVPPSLPFLLLSSFVPSLLSFSPPLLPPFILLFFPWYFPHVWLLIVAQQFTGI